MYGGPYKNDRRLGLGLVCSLPDDGVRSPILNDSDYVYMQGTTPPGSIDTEGIRYGLWIFI